MLLISILETDHVIYLHLYVVLSDHCWYIGVIEYAEFEYATLETLISSIDAEFSD